MTAVSAAARRAKLFTAGAWSAKLVPALAPRFVVVGQPVLHFAPADLAPFEPPRFTPFGADISRTGFYGFCANEGVVKVAYHGAGEPRHFEADRLERLAEQAVHLVAPTAAALVHQLLGFCRDRFGPEWERVVSAVDRGAGSDSVKR